jgi:hypothetical protein
VQENKQHVFVNHVVTYKDTVNMYRIKRRTELVKMIPNTFRVQKKILNLVWITIYKTSSLEDAFRVMDGYKNNVVFHIDDTIQW